MEAEETVPKDGDLNHSVPSKGESEEKPAPEPESKVEDKPADQSESNCESEEKPAPEPESKVEDKPADQSESKGRGEEKSAPEPESIGEGEKIHEQRRPPPVPSLLKELGMKVTCKGVLLPESRKTLLRRRRAHRAALGAPGALGALGSEASAPLVIPAKRKPSHDGRPRPVLLDEIESDLFYGAHQGSVSACAGAVAQGADVNVRNKADLDGIGIGATALHVAAVRGHEDVAAALLHAKADCMALTGRGESPVQLATRMGHVEVVKVLRTAGAAPKHEEGVVQLMSQAPSAWRDGQRKKLRKAITGDGAHGARPKEALPPPPPPPPGVWEGPDESMARPEESPKVKGKGKGKGKRRRKGKEGKPDY